MDRANSIINEQIEILKKDRSRYKKDWIHTNREILGMCNREIVNEITGEMTKDITDFIRKQFGERLEKYDDEECSASVAYEWLDGFKRKWHQ